MSKANTLAGVSVGLAVATFVVLNLIWPFVPTQETLPANPTSDAIFASDIASAPTAEPVVKPQEGETSPVPAIASTAPASSAEAPATETAPPAEPANTTPVQEQIATTPEPSPAMEASAPVESAPAPAEAEPATSENSETSESAATVSAAPAPAKPSKPKATAPRADALDQWWPSTPTAGHLNLLYAGQAAESPAIALLFDSVFADASTAGSGIRVVDGKGNTVDGSWELASNRRLLMLKVKPGRYTVVVGTGLANQRGQTLATELHGPIYVR